MARNLTDIRIWLEGKIAANEQRVSLKDATISHYLEDCDMCYAAKCSLASAEHDFGEAGLLGRTIDSYLLELEEKIARLREERAEAFCRVETYKTWLEALEALEG